MDTSKVVEVLREKTKESDTLNAVMHVIAMRKRARNNLTIGGLDQKMRSEGFTFTKSQYAEVLKLLASLGVGRLDTDAKGKVRALKDIKIKLQSLGEAAVGQAKKLENWRQRHKYSPLVATAEMIKPKAGGEGTGFPVSITVVINGKPVNFRVPKELNENEIADLVVRFRDKV